MKKTIALGLVAAAALALVAGGVGAVETGTQDEQPAETTDAPEEEEYEEKFTADETVAIDLDEENIEMEVVDDTEYDEKFTAEESVAIDLDEENIEMEVVDDTEYDEKFTVDQVQEIDLSDEDSSVEITGDDSVSADA